MSSLVSAAGQGHRRDLPQIDIVEYVDADNTIQRLHADPDVATDFTPAAAIREIHTFPGATNTPGRFWAQSGNAYLPYESYHESRWLQLLDYDPAVVYIMTQPLTLTAFDEDGDFSHTPDVFVRRADGGASLIDITIPRRRKHPDVLRKANASAALCRALNWTYFLVAGLPQPMSVNVDWLSSCRRTKPEAAMLDALLQTATEPVTLRDLWLRNAPATLAKPATGYLLWNRLLHIDINAPMDERSLVWRTP